MPKEAQAALDSKADFRVRPENEMLKAESRRLEPSHEELANVALQRKERQAAIKSASKSVKKAEKEKQRQVDERLGSVFAERLKEAERLSESRAELRRQSVQAPLPMLVSPF